MDFSSGNSGNLLREAVIKTGPGCQQEGAYCQFLGTRICPEVYAIISDSYIMEKLQPLPNIIRYDKELLMGIAGLLEREVWCRPALPSSVDTDWRDNLREYGVETPDWVISQETCLVHGDTTVSNVLCRERQLIIADPRPPRAYIPQYRETDLGRILQSYFGWEAIAYGVRYCQYELPKFRSDLERDRSIFWCGASAARIEHLERSRANRQHILDWCQYVRGICHV